MGKKSRFSQNFPKFLHMTIFFSTNNFSDVSDKYQVCVGLCLVIRVIYLLYLVESWFDRSILLLIISSFRILLLSTMYVFFCILMQSSCCCFTTLNTTTRTEDADRVGQSVSPNAQDASSAVWPSPPHRFTPCQLH